VVVVFLFQGLWLKVIKNERDERGDSECVRAMPVTRARFIMSDDINHTVRLTAPNGGTDMSQICQR